MRLEGQYENYYRSIYENSRFLILGKLLEIFANILEVGENITIGTIKNCKFDMRMLKTVSYTHLTLPTIYSV